MSPEIDVMSLPDDPWEAFVEFERIARERHDKDVQYDVEQGLNNNWNHEVDYMSNVLGAAKAYDIEAFKDWSLPALDNDIGSAYQQFRASITHVCIQLRIQTARRVKLNAVRFDPAARLKLRHLLDQMRATVEAEPNLTPRKRDALSARIADLSAEVDRDWSSVESYGQLALEVADVAGEVGNKLEPVRRILDSIAGVFGSARRDQEQKPRLPAPPKRIEPPKRKKATGFDKPMDDEIPF